MTLKKLYLLRLAWIVVIVVVLVYFTNLCINFFLTHCMCICISIFGATLSFTQMDGQSNKMRETKTNRRRQKKNRLQVHSLYLWNLFLCTENTLIYIDTYIPTYNTTCRCNLYCIVLYRMHNTGICISKTIKIFT